MNSVSRTLIHKIWLLSLFAFWWPTMGTADQNSVTVSDDWTGLSEFVGKPVMVRGYLGFAPNKGREYALYNLTRTKWVKLVVDNFNSLPADASAGKVIVTVLADVIPAPKPTTSLGQARGPSSNECYLVHVKVDGVKVRSSTYDDAKEK